MGPVSATHPSSPPCRLVISAERRAMRRNGTLDLELMLSGVPDRAWLDAFSQPDPESSLDFGPAALEAPRIIHDTIHWTINETCLMPAWWYLGRCMDRANAASFAPRRTALGRNETGIVQTSPSSGGPE